MPVQAGACPTARRNQKPRCKQQGIKLAALPGSGVFDPRGIRQIPMQTWLFFSLLAGIKSAPLHSIIRKRHLKFYEKEEIVKTENSGICLPPPYPGKFHERSPQASQRPKISKKNTVPEIKVIENSAFICASRGSNPGHPD